ncbi:hypothetical protein [Oceanobacillus sojae]|uniref:hypothetical protein n=1 Tax=Oceanobacillus sojae TaxID=582851 RepID=UPI0009885EF6|nr:hypothetical protein [Oceanobacillus sojae]
MKKIGVILGLFLISLLLAACNNSNETDSAEGNWEEPVEIEQESNRGYYVIPSEESERGEYTYISGSEAGEQIYSEDDELFDFGQTIEAMTTTENDDGSYHSGIYEGVEIEEATIDGNQAIVKYHINDDTEASQQEMEDFEQVLQLAALDFQAEELEIINETERIISAYPLLVETEDSANDNSSSEENSNTEDQEENTEITEEDALSIVMDFVDEHKDVDREEVKMMVQDNQETEEYYKIQAFVFSGEEGEDQMTNTVGWYLVDKETGDIEEDM